MRIDFIVHSEIIEGKSYADIKYEKKIKVSR